MPSIDALLSALDERAIAQRIGIPHDEARMRFGLQANTVDNFDEFSDIITAYVQHHFATCVSHGGSLSRAEAAGRAKEVLEREYRRTNGDIVAAFNDARDGTNGGLRAVLDKICEGIKGESVERYIRDAFDRNVAPNEWDEKVAVIRQFIDQCGANLSSSIRADQPERYAHNYNELIRSYVDALQRHVVDLPKAVGKRCPMSTKLDRLLDAIDPQRTLTQADARADEAINSFDMDRGSIERWDDFRHCIATFHRHCEAVMLRLRGSPDVPLDYYWQRSVRPLLDLYGINGEKAAFELARTGNEGGLYGVLKKFAGRLAREYTGNEISALVGTYWNGLSADEQLAAGDEYMEKYGHLLPSEMTEGSAARVRANLPKFLGQHPHLLERLGRVGR